MPTPRRALSSSVVNGKIYALGGTVGAGNPAIHKVEEYDPTSDPLYIIDPTSGNKKLTEFSLFPNYPNPFNPSTTIEFYLPKASEVSLKVFNILGEEVATLVSDRLFDGSYSYKWEASNLSSGVYLYKLEAEGYVDMRKMILMK